MFIRSAKNDHEGVGNKACVLVHHIYPDAPFCLTTDMFVFNKMTRPHANDPFLSFQGKWCYDVSHLVQAMKLLVSGRVSTLPIFRNIRCESRQRAFS